MPSEKSEKSLLDPSTKKKLPAELQKLVDDDDGVLEHIREGTATESTESNVRYAAYASRLRTILLSAHRYVAYTSDIGESFRPVAHPWLIKSAYGISWAYLIGDVGYEGYKSYLLNQSVLQAQHGSKNNRTENASDSSSSASSFVTSPRIAAIDDYRAVMAQRAVFQGLASMGLPAFTIHSIVRYSGQALKSNKNTMIRTYGPIGLGLGAVPFLPLMFDKPVEQATEWVFHKTFEAIGGPDAVTHSPAHSRSLADRIKEEHEKKEL